MASATAIPTLLRSASQTTHSIHMYAIRHN